MEIPLTATSSNNMTDTYSIIKGKFYEVDGQIYQALKNIDGTLSYDQLLGYLGAKDLFATVRKPDDYDTRTDFSGVNSSVYDWYNPIQISSGEAVAETEVTGEGAVENVASGNVTTDTGEVVGALDPAYTEPTSAPVVSEEGSTGGVMNIGTEPTTQEPVISGTVPEGGSVINQPEPVVEQTPTPLTPTEPLAAVAPTPTGAVESPTSGNQTLADGTVIGALDPRYNTAGTAPVSGEPVVTNEYGQTPITQPINQPEPAPVQAPYPTDQTPQQTTQTTTGGMPTGYVSAIPGEPGAIWDPNMGYIKPVSGAQASVTSSPTGTQPLTYYKSLNPLGFYDVFDSTGKHIDLPTFQSLGLNIDHIPLQSPTGGATGGTTSAPTAGTQTPTAGTTATQGATGTTAGATTPTLTNEGVYKVLSPDGHYDVYDAQGNHITFEQFQAAGLNIDQIGEPDIGGIKRIGNDFFIIENGVARHIELPEFQSLGINADFVADGSTVSLAQAKTGVESAIKAMGGDTSASNPIKTRVEEIQSEFQKLNDKYAEDVSDVNDNPWLTEGVRVSRIRKLEEKYDMKKKLLIDELKLFSDNADADTQVVDVDGQKLLINSDTGQVIKILGDSDGDLTTTVREIGGREVLLTYNGKGEVIAKTDLGAATSGNGSDGTDPVEVVSKINTAVKSYSAAYAGQSKYPEGYRERAIEEITQKYGESNRSKVIDAVYNLMGDVPPSTSGGIDNPF